MTYPSDNQVVSFIGSIKSDTPLFKDKIMNKYIPRTNKQLMRDIPNQISVYYHRSNIVGIQKALGKNCTYVSHVRYPNDQYGVVAKFGKLKPIVAMLNGTPNDIKSEYYAQLKNDMTNEASKRGLL